jgi:hypothetical protein
MPDETQVADPTPETTINNPPDITSGLTRMAEIFEKNMVDVRKKMAPETLAQPAATEQQAAPTEPAQPAATDTPAQPAEAAPQLPPEDRPPESMSKAGKENWNRLVSLKNAQIEKLQKEFEAFKAEQAKAPKTGPAPQEFEELKKRYDETVNELEKVALERSSRFRDRFENAVNKHIEVAKAVAGEHGEEVAKLLRQPRSPERNARLAEIREELGIEGDVIASALREITSLNLERDKALSDHKRTKALLDKMDEEQRQQQVQEISARRRQAGEQILSKIKTLPEFNPDGKDPKHGEWTKEAIGFIEKANAGSITEEDSALLPAMAMKGAYLQQFRVPALEKEVETLRARLNQLQGASPKLENRTSGATQQGVPDPMKSSFVAKFEELMRK